MPAIGTGTGKKAGAPTHAKPPKPKPTYGPPAPKPSSPTKPAPIFRGPATVTKPFQPQKDQAAAKATARLPKAPIATPPVIRNPTPAQTHEAARLISSSITKIVGSGGSNAEKLARRDALLQQVRTDPRYKTERASINHWNSELGKITAPQTDTVKAGAPPTKAKLGVGPFSFGTINLTAATQAAKDHLPAGIKSGTDEAQFVRNALKDVGTLGSAPFVGAVGLGGVGVDLATGHPKRAASKVGAFGKGMVGYTVNEVKHPEQSLREHPLLTTLDLLGATSLAGHAAGAISRAAGDAGAGGVRGALAEHSHTVRPPISMTDDAGQPAIVQRTYSKDLTRRAVQVSRDRGREPLLDAHGRPVTIQDRGHTVPVLKSSASEKERFAKRRADFVASRGNMQERQARDVATKASKVRGVKGKRAEDIVAMTVEGTLRSAQHFADDLRGERDRIQARIAAHHNGTDEFPLGDVDLKKAQDRLKTVQAVLRDPKAMAQGPRIVAEAERHGTLLNAGDAANAAVKIIDPDAARRSALIVPALRHMGARHYTVAEHAQLERDARVAEDAAAARVATAPTPAARQAALADLKTARDHRIDVSGREPVATRAHEDAKATAAVATQRVKQAKVAEEKASLRIRDLVAKHRSERGREAHHGPVAKYYVGQQEFTLRQDAVAHARATGVPIRDIRRVATTSGEARRVGEISQARRALVAVKARRRTAETASRKADRDVAAHPLPDATAAIRYGPDSHALGFGKPAGAFLPTSDIEDFLRLSGRDPDTVAYLPHNDDVIGSRAFHAQQRPGARPQLATTTRTGKAYLDAVTNSSQRILHEQGVRQVVKLNQAKQLDQLVADHALRHPAWAKHLRGEPLTAGEQRIVDKGGLFTAEEARQVVRRVGDGQRLTPMTAYQAKLDPETRRVIREDLQGPGAMDSIVSRMLNDRIVRPGDTIDPKARNVVLVPSGLVERLEAHLTPAGQVEKVFQWVNKPFRMAVLPQPRWLTGNFVESYLVRLPTVGSGLVNVPGMLVDVRAANRILRALDNGTPEMRAQAEAIRAQQTGSGLSIGGRGAGVHRTISDILPPAARLAYGRLVAKLPVVEQMADMGRTAAHWITAPLQAFFQLNRHLIENPAQKIAFGHQARADIQAITGSWIKSITLSRQAVEDAAKGLTDTAAQQRFMRAQEELLGKYAGFSPTMRAFTQSVAPFLPWTLNAARFVFWTMPAHHTALTALLVKTQDTMAKDWAEIHKNTPPGDLRNAIPNGKGGWLDIQRYTPYGLSGPIANGGDLTSLTGQFTPQFGGALNAAAGRDPFGSDLKVQPGKGNPKGEPTTTQKAWIAGYDLLEAVTPYLSTVRRLREHGETAYGDSTIVSPKTKRGTSHGMSAARRTFDPLRPTYLGPGNQPPPAASKPKRQPPQAAAPPEDPVQAALDAAAAATEKAGGGNSPDVESALDAMK